MAARWLLPILVLAAGPAAAQTPVAVFPFELADTSGEAAPSSSHDARIALATDHLARKLEQSGRYRPVDLSPLAAEVAATAPRYDCGGCWLEVARKSGAELAVLPAVHKVSTLISTMDLWVADLRSGQYVAHVTGQIRGDTDTAWLRGVDFLVDERLLRQAPP
ncbi:DUF3280 domain-containing protein [Inquilinus limosus]|uniref:DUF2380 domain-containing protein n=1 Tax=Inquilinus limosus TaxID=171674 RepID=A0A211ZP00_9PROT|nr:DUF3280 domain-containing protein [Inquilinus limosus]OWJ66980.1 hypothetical protein BWR60_11935 [Inquilinus limosus]